MKRMVWTPEVYNAYLEYYPLNIGFLTPINKFFLRLIAKPFIRVADE